jgi:hypothetical protein
MDLLVVSEGSMATMDTRHGTLMVHWSLPAGVHWVRMRDWY